MSEPQQSRKRHKVTIKSRIDDIRTRLNREPNGEGFPSGHYSLTSADLHTVYELRALAELPLPLYGGLKNINDTSSAGLRIYDLLEISERYRDVSLLDEAGRLLYEQAFRSPSSWKPSYPPSYTPDSPDDTYQSLSITSDPFGEATKPEAIAKGMKTRVNIYQDPSEPVHTAYPDMLVDVLEQPASFSAADGQYLPLKGPVYSRAPINLISAKEDYDAPETLLYSIKRQKSCLTNSVLQPQESIHETEHMSKPRRCSRCLKSKKGCDRQRPCQRCQAAGLGADQCISEETLLGNKPSPKASIPRDRPPGKASKVKAPDHSPFSSELYQTGKAPYTSPYRGIPDKPRPTQLPNSNLSPPHPNHSTPNSQFNGHLSQPHFHLYQGAAYPAMYHSGHPQANAVQPLRPYHPQTSSFQPPPSLPTHHHTTSFPSSNFYSFQAPGIHGPSLQDPTRNRSNEGINPTTKPSWTPNQTQTLLEAAPVSPASSQPFHSQPPAFPLSTLPSELVLSDPSPMPSNPRAYTSSTQPEQNRDSVPFPNQSLNRQPPSSTVPTNNPSYVCEI
jgi:hypothetical protein